MVSVKSSIDIKNIKRSVSFLGMGIKKANFSVTSINSTLFTKNKNKRQAISQDNILFQARRDAVRRKEQEDIIEASTVAGPIKRQGKVISSSTRGFLGRIFDFIGTVLTGWLLQRLPIIIKLAEELIKKIQKIVGVLGGFVTGVTQILSAFGSLLQGSISNLIRFDFSNQSQLLQDSLQQIDLGFKKIEKSIESSISILKEPLNLTIETEDEEENKENQTNPFPTTTTSGSGGQIQPIHKQALDIISKPESGGDYNAMNNGQSGDRPGGSKKWLGKNLTDMTIGEVKNYQNNKQTLWAAGRYQIIPRSLPTAQSAVGLKDSDMFDQNNQDLMGIGLLKVQGPSAWSAYSRYSKQEIDIMNKAKNTPLGQPSTPISPPSPTNQPSPPVNQSKRYTIGQSIQGVGSVTSKRGSRVDPISGGSGWHGGLDIGMDIGIYISCKYPASVDYSGNQSGYGNLIDIRIPALGVILRFAHLSRILISSGNIPAGTPFALSGNSGGRTTGPHVHMEAHGFNETSKQLGYGGDRDPSPYVEFIMFTKSAPKGFVAPPTPTKIENPAKISTVNSAEQQTKKSSLISSPDRSGPTVVVQQPDMSSQAPACVYGGNQSSSIPSSSEMVLNKFISQRLLLELAYT